MFHESPPREHVLLVHGFLAHRVLLALLAGRLRQDGFHAQTWGYQNMFCSLMVHAHRFAEKLAELDADPQVDRLHCVGHSMGGIICRAALAQFRPQKLGRLVMLASPNRGSPVATATAHSVGRVLRPVRELATTADSLVNKLPPPTGFDVGVIAARHDALVTEESTKVDAPHDHAVVPTWHTGLLFRRDTAVLVSSFLRTGSFGSLGPPVTT
jgi:alpha-beta hydrolase superfamily lysophospholipase